MTPTERSRAWALAHPERIKATKQRHLERLKAWRLANPEKAKEVQARWREKNRDSHRAAIKRWRDKNKDRVKQVERERSKRRFFQRRASASVCRTKQGDIKQLTTAIFWLWHKQRGRCALTGKRLDRTAELDHIIPVSKGGKNEPSNLQWLAPEINQCKNDLTDQEFIAICKAVLSHKL